MLNLYFSYPCDSALWWEADQRELLSPVYLDLGGDKFIAIEFITLRRLTQDYEGHLKRGQTFYPITNTIIIPDINFRMISDAIGRISDTDFLHCSQKISRNEIGELWPLEP